MKITDKMNQLSVFKFTAVALLLFVITGCDDKIDAISGATPIATNKTPEFVINLEVSGETDKTYRFDKKDISNFQATSIRTREVNAKGEYEGAYRYTGVQLINLIEGIIPQKKDKNAFNRPLDLLVIFTNDKGEKSYCSYGELAFTDDQNPILLAYYRSPIEPKETPDSGYPYTKYHENLNGLRLVVPGDKNNKRYLNNVTKIEFVSPDTGSAVLPKTVKGLKCSSSEITGYYNGKQIKVSESGLSKVKVDRWVRVGHGKGYKGISTAEGYRLNDLLRKNFADCSEDKLYLFVACDGYRALFTGYELFGTESGAKALLLTSMDNKADASGPMLGPIGDFFVDRDVWGLSHIVVIDMAK